MIRKKNLTEVSERASERVRRAPRSRGCLLLKLRRLKGFFLFICPRLPQMRCVLWCTKSYIAGWAEIEGAVWSSALVGKNVSTRSSPEAPEEELGLPHIFVISPEVFHPGIGSCHVKSKQSTLVHQALFCSHFDEYAKCLLPYPGLCWIRIRLGLWLVMAKGHYTLA